MDHEDIIYRVTRAHATLKWAVVRYARFWSSRTHKSWFYADKATKGYIKVMYVYVQMAGLPDKQVKPYS